jgi:hypothetical protein
MKDIMPNRETHELPGWDRPAVGGQWREGPRRVDVEP